MTLADLCKLFEKIVYAGGVTQYITNAISSAFSRQRQENWPRFESSSVYIASSRPIGLNCKSLSQKQYSSVVGHLSS